MKEVSADGKAMARLAKDISFVALIALLVGAFEVWADVSPLLLYAGVVGIVISLVVVALCTIALWTVE